MWRTVHSAVTCSDDEGYLAWWLSLTVLIGITTMEAAVWLGHRLQGSLLVSLAGAVALILALYVPYIMLMRFVFDTVCWD